MVASPRLTYIVPTVGRSPHLQACLRALATAGGGDILLAAESGTDLSEIDGFDGIQRVTVPKGSGFAGACNNALTQTDAEYIALVNDDALVSSDWHQTLISILQEDPRIAAVQGTNVCLVDSDRIDGCGIGWNRSWQAIQIDGGSAPDIAAPIREVFGVSGTAAVFRRSSLEATALPGGHYFDTLLGTYYEDVELACRLRSGGFQAVHVPAAVARHGGSSSSLGAQRWRWTQIHGNRVLVLARLWGRAFPLRLPTLWIRDSLDFVRALIGADVDRLKGIVWGWGRAARYLGSFAHLGPPMLTADELHRFRVTGRKGAPLS